MLGLVEDFRPDLLLLDLKMPRVDGSQILERLRSGEHAALPVLVLTADATSEGRQRAIEAGAGDILTKPLDVAEVLRCAGEMLETRSAPFSTER